jgi:hypothetical protein
MWCVPGFDEKVKEHPALLGWIHRDEPDMPRKGKPKEPLDVTADRYKKIKAGDTTHPVFLTLTFHFSEQLSNKYKDKTFYREYKDMTDVLGFDYYPIFGYMHTENLHLVGDGMKELRKLSDDKRPMFAWIETNGGSRWISPANQRQVYPYEIRAEVYMAIISGAQAIGYFPHTWVAAEKLGDPKYTERGGIEGDYASFAVPPENQKELKKINSQITRLTPVLCSANKEVMVKVKSDGRVDCMVKEYNNKVYIFAVNMNRKPANAEFSVKGLKKGTPIVADEEDRKITAIEGGFTDQFADYAVHIYSFPVNR